MDLEGVLDSMPYFTCLEPVANTAEAPLSQETIPEAHRVLLSGMTCEFRVLMKSSREDLPHVVPMEFQSPHQMPTSLSRIPFKLMASEYHLILLLYTNEETSMAVRLDHTKVEFLASTDEQSHPSVNFPYLCIVIHSDTAASNSHGSDENDNKQATPMCIDKAFRNATSDFSRIKKRMNHPIPKDVTVDKVKIDGTLYRTKGYHPENGPTDLDTFSKQMEHNKLDMMNLSRQMGIYKPSKRAGLMTALIGIRRRLEVDVASLKGGGLRKVLDKKRAATAAKMNAFRQDYEKNRKAPEHIEGIQAELKQYYALELLASHVV